MYMKVNKTVLKFYRALSEIIVTVPLNLLLAGPTVENKAGLLCYMYIECLSAHWIQVVCSRG